MVHTNLSDNLWQPVKIGAGGWVTGIDIAVDGTMVARTDTYGAYIWNGTEWKQLVTVSSMPAGTTSAAGVYEIRIAASNSNILYMETGDGIYKSVNKGETWTKTNFPVTPFDANGGNRMDGQKMAIDPSNPNIVFAGTQENGLWVTRDGGSTWQHIAAVPEGANAGDSGLTGIVIQGSTVYVGTAGSGVYQSKDGGYTWSAIGGPTDISQAAIASDGSYYASGNTDGALWKYTNGAWTKVMANTGQTVHAVAVDPFNPAHIIVTNDGGALRESKDGGATWGDWNWGAVLESSNDVPWLESSGQYMSTGGLIFDPQVSGKIYQSAGVGVWQAQMPSDMVWNTKVVWNSQSAGIEQLVANDIIAPAGGDPVFGSWDRAFFAVSDPDSYASSYGGGQFSMGWSVDYASSNPSFVVGISDYWGTENSGFSTDGGKTWQKFAGLPSFALNTIGGTIAAASPTNFIWAASGNQAPAYTLDGGKTWASIEIAGKTDWSAFHWAYYLNKTTITADRVQPNTFYLYDVATGVYRSTDGGVNWTKVFNGEVTPFSGFNSKIEAVPGRAGELFFTAGPVDNAPGVDPLLPTNVAFMHSKDGGATWQAVPNVIEVHTFGYGAAASQGGPATIYIVGYVNQQYGIWYSTDNAGSWTQIGSHPGGSLDTIKTISGDMDHFGLVYVGFLGSGYAYLNLADDQPQPSTPSAPSAPSQLATIVSALDDVGTPATVGNGSIINDATPTLSGTLSSGLDTGQSLVVYRDGQRLTQLSPTTTSWKFTDSGAADGTHQYVVRVENAAGQAGSYSPAFSLTIDTLAPTQMVIVTGVGTGLSAKTEASSLLTAMSYLITGNISAQLAPGETLNVLRDGVRVGTATVTAGNWSFNDNARAGSYTYAAQVQDAAGNLGQLSTQYTMSTGTQYFYGTIRSDVITGTHGADQLSGVPSTGSHIGKGTIDVLTGRAGADVFVLGDARGRFYDDGASRAAGTGDYARITDFGADDKLQLNGAATEYFQRATTLKGSSGTGIYHDTNKNGIIDSRDELIALIQNHGPLDPDKFIFVSGNTPNAPLPATTADNVSSGGGGTKSETTVRGYIEAEYSTSSIEPLDSYYKQLDMTQKAALDAGSMMFIY
jgi:hypothetical protein